MNHNKHHAQGPSQAPGVCACSVALAHASEQGSHNRHANILTIVVASSAPASAGRKQGSAEVSSNDWSGSSSNFGDGNSRDRISADEFANQDDWVLEPYIEDEV